MQELSYVRAVNEEPYNDIKKLWVGITFKNLEFNSTRKYYCEQEIL